MREALASKDAAMEMLQSKLNDATGEDEPAGEEGDEPGALRGLIAFSAGKLKGVAADMAGALVKSKSDLEKANGEIGTLVDLLNHSRS